MKEGIYILHAYEITEDIKSTILKGLTISLKQLYENNPNRVEEESAKYIITNQY